MIPMDAEGITWVGTIHQKFEAVCLEVEEDTIKYMESQVQTVGVSVQKFYPDVMQDLLLPFSSDNDEIAVSNSPVVKYSDAGLCKTSLVNKDVTPKPCITAKYENSESQRKKKNSEVIAVVNKNVSPISIFGGLHENREQFGCFPVVNKNLEKKELHQSKITAENISAGRDGCKALSLSEELNASNKVNCPDAKKLSSVELHVALFDKSQSEESIHNTITSSSSNFPEEPNGYWDQKTCREMWSDLPVLETEAAAETDKEMMLHVDKLKLEETCVLVSKDDFHFVSQTGSNSQPYKKKIRQVFSSRKKSARMQEYEELAIQHGNSAKNNQVYAESRDSTYSIIDPNKSPPDFRV